MRIVIVGGVAAGVTAATRLKRLMEKAEVVLYERAPRISFANCALAYCAGGVLDYEDLFAARSGRLSKTSGVKIHERHEVTRIDRDRKVVEVRNLETGDVFETSYDALVLATGADPRILPIEGLAENAHPLWRPEDALRLRDAMKAKPGLRVGIVGGGAVGLETAENVVRAGGEADLMEYGPTVMGRNDPALSRTFLKFVEKAPEARGRLRIHTQTSVVRVVRPNPEGAMTLELSNGTSTEVDFLVSAAGVAPRSKLAADAGLELGPRGTIVVDGFGRTSDPSIYAAGDVAVSPDPSGGPARPMMLAGTAVKEGRQVADAIAGLAKTPLPGGFGTNALECCGTLWCATGANETSLITAGKKPRRDFWRATVFGSNHVSWYPGSSPMILKVLFDRTGKLLGAQAIGKSGVDKRIDILSTALRFGATVHDLAQLDLCYAPQTGTPKDPVNIAGHLGENILNDLVRFIEPQELLDLMEGRAPDLGDDVPTDPARVTLLDVREADEVAIDRLPWNLVHVPLGSLRERLADIPDEGPVVVICRSGVRAYTAARILEADGHDNVFTLTGGMQYWHLALGR